MLLAALAALVASVHAATLAGVTLPDASTVAGTPVRLNGMGLREKYFLDIYVGGLYLQTPTTDGAAAIRANEAKRMEMHFVYGEVSRDQMVASFTEDFSRRSSVVGQASHTAEIIGWLPESVKRGDTISFEYAPSTGTSMLLNGRRLGTIPGTEFMTTVFGVYLGDRPPTEALKVGLLGG